MHKPFHLLETLAKKETQPLLSGPLFFGAGAALVLVFAVAEETLLFAAIALGAFCILLLSGIIIERRLYLSYEGKYAGRGAEGVSTLRENIPYHTLIRGNVDSANWKFAIVSPEPRDKDQARFILTEDYFSDSFIKIGHRILPLKDISPGVKSEPVKGVVHQLDIEAVVAARPAEQHKRQGLN